MRHLDEFEELRILRNVKGIKPHQHFNLNHCDDGIPATKEQFSLAAKIRKEFHLK